MTLKSARVGDTVRVLKVEGEGPIRRRIMDLGITKGVEIYVRKDDAKMVLIEKISSQAPKKKGEGKNVN